MISLAKYLNFKSNLQLEFNYGSCRFGFVYQTNIVKI